MRSVLLWSWAPSRILRGRRYHKFAATAAYGVACTSRSVPRVRHNEYNAAGACREVDLRLFGLTSVTVLCVCMHVCTITVIARSKVVYHCKVFPIRFPSGVYRKRT